MWFNLNNDGFQWFTTQCWHGRKVLVLELKRTVLLHNLNDFEDDTDCFACHKTHLMHIRKKYTLDISFQTHYNVKQLLIIHNKVGASIVVIVVKKNNLQTGFTSLLLESNLWNSFKLYSTAFCLHLVWSECRCTSLSVRPQEGTP